MGLRLSVHIVTLHSQLAVYIYIGMGGGKTYGQITINENKNPVLSQFIAVSVTLKYSADFVETGAKVNH